MGLQENCRDCRESLSRQFTQTQAVCVVVSSLIYDIILYTGIMPLLATYLGGSVASHLQLTPKWELVYTVGFTFGLLYISFGIFGESALWKELFSFNGFYCCLLQVRDLINTATIIACLIYLQASVEAMMDDKQMKKNHIGEGASYVFIKTICKGFNLDSALLLKFGLKPPHKGTLTDPNFGENERFEHAAAYMLYWAMLAAGVAKLIYFNTLFTYVRAMRIFVSLDPNFEEVSNLSSFSTIDGSFSQMSNLSLEEDDLIKQKSLSKRPKTIFTNDHNHTYLSTS